MIGISGAGKSTLARRLALLQGAAPIELDALYWGPHWTRRPLAAFRRDVEAAVQPDRWTVDGNYRTVRDLVWPRATCVVWLNLSLPRVFWHVLRRTLQRARTRQVLWSGNREDWRRAFCSRESILWWVLTMYRRRQREFAALKQAADAGPVWIELRTPRQVQAWLRRQERAGDRVEVQAWTS